MSRTSMRHCFRIERIRTISRSARYQHTTVVATASLPHTSHPFPTDPAVPPTEASVSPRQERIRKAEPFSSFLTDNFHRQHDYLRISVTERCNLRCTYCMPEAGVPLSPPEHLLTTPEITYLSDLFVGQGVKKIRLTGGEPTIRRDILPMMRQIGDLRSKGLKELCLTTNGLTLHRKLDSMVEAGLTGINLSLDTLDPFQFQIMTRRKGFEAVMKSMKSILELNRLGAGIKLKINCVVMRGVNEREILPFVDLCRENDLEVRFIEYMPFDGNKWSQGKMMGYKEMLAIIREKHPALYKVQDHKNDTSKTYAVPGFVGKMGFITSMTHNFCGTCNRLRITSDGNLKVCLFGNSEVSLRDLLREDNDGQPIDEEAIRLMKERQINEYRTSAILSTIGTAVKRKKEKHAGMGELEHMKNRPMILIGGFLLGELTARSQPAAPSSSNNKNTHISGFHAECQRWVNGSPGIPTQWLNILRSSPIPPVSARYFTSTPSPVPPVSAGLSATNDEKTEASSTPPSFPHLSIKSEARVVSISHKRPTFRRATATGNVLFSDSNVIPRIRAHTLRKGDVLSVARIAGIQAVKKTSDIIPLTHSGLPIEGIDIDMSILEGTEEYRKRRAAQMRKQSNSSKIEGFTVTRKLTTPKNDDGTSKDPLLHTSIPKNAHGAIRILVSVQTTGKTGVEMEALTGVLGAALSIVDMCKAVDREIRIDGVKVLGKEGGKSGAWGIYEKSEKNQNKGNGNERGKVEEDDGFVKRPWRE